jgi:HK97 family phage prohead protease
MKNANGSRTREAGGAVRLALGTSVTPSADGGRYVDVIASTADVDRHGSTLDQTTWLLDSYLANSVILHEHRTNEGLGLDAYDPSFSLPIGFASNVRVEDGALKARLNFVTAEANPLAEKVYQSFLQGSLRAVSVGFIPHSAAVEVRDGEELLVLSQLELLEISTCALPVNPFAVAEAQVRSLSALRARATATQQEKSMTITKADAPAPEAKVPPAAEVPAEKAEAQPVQCATCEAVNPGSNKFCGQCGLAFPAPAPAEPDGDEAAPADGAPKDKAVLLALTGKASHVEALGTVRAWKVAAEELPKAYARIAELEGVQVADERRALISSLVEAKKLTPAMRAWADTCDLAGLKSFAQVAAPVAGLSAKKHLEPAGKGKRWEELSNMERHSLHTSSPEEFDALLTEYRTRQSAGR